MKTLHQNLKVSKTTGKELIINEKTLFSGYLDSGFRSIKNNEKTINTEMAVLELDKNVTFVRMFTHPEEMYVTQGQVIDFINNHKDKLIQNGYGNFFLLKSNNEFFVANVYVYDVGGLEVYVDSFSDDYIWYGDFRHYVFLPQQSLKYFESSSLDTSIPLSLDDAIKLLKENGYKITREF